MTPDQKEHRALQHHVLSQLQCSVLYRGSAEAAAHQPNHVQQLTLVVKELARSQNVVHHVVENLAALKNHQPQRRRRGCHQWP